MLLWELEWQDQQEKNINIDQKIGFGEVFENINFFNWLKSKYWK